MRRKNWKWMILASVFTMMSIMFGSDLDLQASAPEVTIEGEQPEAYGSQTGSAGTSAAYVLENNVLTISGTGVISEIEIGFYEKNSVTSIVINEGITGIGDNAFKNYEKVTSIVIPSSVTSIGKKVFWCCKSLTDIALPSGITTIGDGAFYNCEKLASIVWPTSVTTIGMEAFQYCDSLTSIELPSGVTTIGEKAFARKVLIRK